MSDLPDPDDDIYVHNLKRVGADAEVVERARAQVTAENFVPIPGRSSDLTGRIDRALEGTDPLTDEQATALEWVYRDIIIPAIDAAQRRAIQRLVITAVVAFTAGAALGAAL